MARESSITIEQVHAVADAIRAEGGKPTSRAVRERLGNIGSMGTVNRFLQQWKASHERKATNALALPATLQNSILDFMEQELAMSRAALEAELAEQQQEASDLAAENERQTELIERLGEQVAGLGEERAAAEGKAAQLAADLEAAHAEAGAERQAAEHARTELAKALLRLEAMPRLVEDLENSRAEAAGERAARIEAERSTAVLESQKSDLQSRLGAAATMNETLREEVASAKAAAEAEVVRVRDEAAKEVVRVRDEAAKQSQQVRVEAAERQAETRAELARSLELLEQQKGTVETLNAALNAATAEARRAAEEAAELRGRQAGSREASSKAGSKSKGAGDES